MTSLPSVPAALPPLIPFGNSAVLVVDDNGDCRDTLAAILEFHGAAVIQAASVDEALQDLKTVAPNLVITDIKMHRPDDGFRLLDSIRSSTSPAVARVPVIAVTGYQDVVEQLWAVKFDDVLFKPVTIETLTRMVARLVPPS